MSNPQLTEEMQRIIEVANELLSGEGTAGSTSEVIAAAFILNDAKYLPASYPNMVEAWERLGHWQELVRHIQQHYMHLIHFRA